MVRQCVYMHRSGGSNFHYIEIGLHIRVFIITPTYYFIPTKTDMPRRQMQLLHLRFGICLSFFFTLNMSSPTSINHDKRKFIFNQALLFYFTVLEANIHIAAGYIYIYMERVSDAGLNSIAIASSGIPISRPKHYTSIHGRSLDGRQDLGDKHLRRDVTTGICRAWRCRHPQIYFISFNIGPVTVPVANQVVGACHILARGVVVELDPNIVE